MIGGWLGVGSSRLEYVGDLDIDLYSYSRTVFRCHGFSKTKDRVHIVFVLILFNK